MALYAKTHPDYVNYLYLLAPVNLVILNPFGFVLMEVGRQSDSPGHSKCGTVMKIARNIATNPIVLMTSLGIAANLLFDHQLPSIIDDILQVSIYRVISMP